MNKGCFTLAKISIILPAYNTEEFIEECVNSLKKQTYTTFEVILVDDGSSASCRESLQEIAENEQRIRLFHLEKHGGVGAARNFGLSKAEGEFVYFLDSDDYLHERTLEFLVKGIKNNEMICGRVYATNLSDSFAITYDGIDNLKMYYYNRFELLNHRSAQNFLIRRDFIIKHRLTFAEDVQVYSDLSFMVPAMLNVTQLPYAEEAIYFRRRRNDPILNPSLIQSEASVKLNDFITMFKMLKDKYDNDLVNDYLDQQMVQFYRKNITAYYKDEQLIDMTFEDVSYAIKQVQSKKIEPEKKIVRIEIKHLLSGNLNRFKRVNRRHRFLRELRKGTKSKRKFYIFLYRYLFLKLPVNKKLVFFESFLGKNYSDSPKYIYEYMNDHKMNFKYVWSFTEKKTIPGKSKQVERFSLRYFYMLARAKYWVNNSRMPRYLDKRPENIYLQTWHGTPLKQLVFDMDDVFSADAKYKRNFYDQSRRWEYLSSPNQYSSDIFKRAFQFDKEMLEYGYPRNDILYTKNTSEDINKLKEKLGLPLDKKVVLYAPTWRDDEFYERGKYKFTLKLNLKKMQKELGNEYIILLRMHYFIASEMDITGYEGFVYDFSSYNDIAELYLMTDILITDYSSVFFDYANLKRPILFFTYDLEKYRDTLRGFYIDIEKDVPGPLLRTSNQVIEAIKDINTITEEYKETYDIFYDRFCDWDDGNAAKKTVEKVFN